MKAERSQLIPRKHIESLVFLPITNDILLLMSPAQWTQVQTWNENIWTLTRTIERARVNNRNQWIGWWHKYTKWASWRSAI